MTDFMPFFQILGQAPVEQVSTMDDVNFLRFCLNSYRTLYVVAKCLPFSEESSI